MQHGDCNTPARMVGAMNDIFWDMIYKDLIIYIDDIIISSKNYKQDVEALRKILQHLQDQQFWLKENKCQFITKGWEILGHILTTEGVSADALKIQKIFDYSEPGDKRQLQAFIGIVNYLSNFWPNVASTDTFLTDLYGTPCA